MEHTTEMMLAELKQQCEQAQELCFVNGEIQPEQVQKFRALVYQYQALKQKLVSAD